MTGFGDRPEADAVAPVDEELPDIFAALGLDGPPGHAAEELAGLDEPLPFQDDPSALAELPPDAETEPLASGADLAFGASPAAAGATDDPVGMPMEAGPLPFGGEAADLPFGDAPASPAEMRLPEQDPAPPFGATSALGFDDDLPLPFGEAPADATPAPFDLAALPFAEPADPPEPPTEAVAEIPGRLRPDAVIGLFGKLPAHGDFVRRALPKGFCDPWDDWLARGIQAAREKLGDGFAAVWDAAPVWRFALPPGACGPDAVAGILAPSADTVGRRFPLTVAGIAAGGANWSPGWFAALEGLVLTARGGALDADALAAALPGVREVPPEEAPAPGWWTAATAAGPGLVWPLPELPAPEEFVLLLETVA